MTNHAIGFGPFRLLPAQQLLLAGDEPVRLGSRALDILAALVERPGEIVSKRELVGRVWPDTVVEENNLRVHVAALRKALGDGRDGHRYIANVPGRGYRFVAPVARAEATPEPGAEWTAPEPYHNLPLPLARMLGRDGTVAALAAQLPSRRFVTLAGPGGIGKTTVALAVADRLLDAYDGMARFVDLAPLADPQEVPAALAAVLGAAGRAGGPPADLVAFLRDKRMLLVLDSCEHVVEAAAALAEAILKGAPMVAILATSREPLRAEGERVQRLSPLAMPDGSEALTAAEALAFPAVRLFAERAAACADRFTLGDADVPVVVDICRRLDGIPLAIELAAGRVDALGVRGLAAQLDERLRILSRGRRTALPRHRTLTATLDWSHALLSEPERRILRRLAVFPGSFSLEAASAVAADAEIAVPDVVEGVANLVTKSLVTADVGSTSVRYRLLGTTRAYALAKLAASGEREQIVRRHANHCRGSGPRGGPG